MAIGDITFKTPIVFDSGNSFYISSTQVDDDRFAIAYRGGVGNKTYTIVGDTSGSNTVFGSPAELYPSEQDPTTIVLQDTNKITSFFRGGSRTAAKSGTLTGTTISLGSLYTGIPTVIGNYALAPITSTTGILHVVNGISGTSGVGMDSYLYTVSGTSITIGSAYYLSSTGNLYFNNSGHGSVKIDTDKVLVVYRDGGNSDYGTAVVLTNNSGVLSYGTPVVFDSQSVRNSAVCLLEDNKVYLSYRISTGSDGFSNILSVSGTTISTGTAVAIHEPNDYNIQALDVVSLSANRVGIAFSAYDLGTGNYALVSIVSNISGSTITFGNESKLNKTAFYLSTAKLDVDNFTISYQDNSNSGYGTSVICAIESDNFNYITDGTITVDGISVYSQVGIYKYITDGTITIDGSSITNVDIDYDYITSGTITIDGSSVYTKEGFFNYITSGTITIDGSSITNVDIDYDYITSGTITIDGSSVYSDLRWYGKTITNFSSAIIDTNNNSQPTIENNNLSEPTLISNNWSSAKE